MGTWRASSLTSSILMTRNYQSSYLDVKRNFMNTSSVPRRRKSGQDHVDSFLEEIGADLPSDLDLTVEGIVDRIGSINRRIKRMHNDTLDELGLTMSDWHV